MPMVVLDCETFSDLNVKVVGSRRYANHPSTRPLMWAVRTEETPRALVYEEPDVWKLLKQLKKGSLIRGWVRDELLTVCHWGPFDRFIVDPTHTTYTRDTDGAFLGPHNTRWIDLSEVSLTLGGPAQLKQAASFWLDAAPGSGKDEGTALITRFCSPNKRGEIHDRSTDPIRWERFRSYAAQDANVTWDLALALDALVEEVGERPEAHAQARAIVDKMNERGVVIDMWSVNAVANAVHRIGRSIQDEATRKYDLNLRSPKRVAEYLGTPDCQRETIEAVIERGTFGYTEAQLKVAEARLIVSGAATAKLDAMRNQVDENNILRDMFVYPGAWTRRLTGKGVQLQNMVRKKIDPAFFDRVARGEGLNDLALLQHARDNIRGFIVGNPLLVAADYSQIELRVAAWLAGEEWLLKELRGGADVYRVAGARALNTTPDKITAEQRQIFKAVELACQFGLSATGRDGDGGLYANLRDQGIDMSPRQCKAFVDNYRTTHPNIEDTWRVLDAAVKTLVRRKEGVIEVGRIRLIRTENALIVERPSGFRQYLWAPWIEVGHWDNGDERVNVMFWGKGDGGYMAPTSTYGAKIFQGAVQGTAADIMYHGMHSADLAGYQVAMSVHDEIVANCFLEEGEDPEEVIQVLCDTICQLPKWAEGLPIKAEGWINERYTK